MKTVTLYRDFKEDHRTSMEVYGDNLTAALNNIDQIEFNFTGYRPYLGSVLRHLPEKANLQMRAARYISYPHQAAKAMGDINHIMDHGYAHLLGNLDPAKTIITVHDIIPILAGKGLIHGVTDQRRAHLAEWTSRFYKKAARIIAISESTKRDLVKYCGCDENKVSVIYFGISSLFRCFSEHEKESLRKKLCLPENKYLILITGQQFYKNQSTSLKVMRKLTGQYGENIQLVRLGRITNEWLELCTYNNFTITRHCGEQSDETISKGHPVIQIDYQSNEQMVQIYNAVDCLLFPSWYEGFGLPPVEAMACGTPVVASNAASLPEAIGNAGITAAPGDIEALATGVQRLLEDGKFRNEMIEKGLEQAKKFSWEKCASEVLEVYKNVM